MIESRLNSRDAVCSAIVPAGDFWIHEIRGGRLPDRRPEGNQAVDTLFYNAHDYADRYSAQDTIREQRNIYLTTGTKLMSNRRQRDADHRRGHLRAARHAGRRLRHGEQSWCATPSKSVTCTPAAELPEGALSNGSAAWTSATSPATSISS